MNYQKPKGNFFLRTREKYKYLKDMVGLKPEEIVELDPNTVSPYILTETEDSNGFKSYFIDKENIPKSMFTIPSAPPPNDLKQFFLNTDNHAALAAVQTLLRIKETLKINNFSEASVPKINELKSMFAKWISNYRNEESNYKTELNKYPEPEV